MARYRAVIDTNVLDSGLYSATGAAYQVLRLIERGRVIPLLSTTLLFEYEDVLKRNQEILKLSDRAVEDVLDGLCSRAECIRIHFLWRPQLRDPKDDHVLELAVAAGGADIVTYNVKDFTNASSFGVKIITPAKLLGELK
ncbi:MAG: putative toxin-antitoxin system toxin component, PIN family [Verrucomicrobia bacterium]|nr:putative toxin-antitoxin system toxin component, PIN family [Verrucomicrobiota bacterium]